MIKLRLKKHMQSFYFLIEAWLSFPRIIEKRREPATQSLIFTPYAKRRIVCNLIIKLTGNVLFRSQVNFRTQFSTAGKNVLNDAGCIGEKETCL